MPRGRRPCRDIHWGWLNFQQGVQFPVITSLSPSILGAMQIRQKLPGQTGYDPTFPLLPQSTEPHIPYTMFEMYILANDGGGGTKLTSS